jgi:hypothetical protein
VQVPLIPRLRKQLWSGSGNEVKEPVLNPLPCGRTIGSALILTLKAATLILGFSGIDQLYNPTLN